MLVWTGPFAGSSRNRWSSPRPESRRSRPAPCWRGFATASPSPRRLGPGVLIVGAASTGIRAAGLVAALSSGVWFDFFLTEPYQRLAIDDRDDIEATILLVLIGAAVTEVALWGHRAQARANRRAGYLDGVLATAETATRPSDRPEELIADVSKQITQVLECREGPVRARAHSSTHASPILDHQGRCGAAAT